MQRCPACGEENPDRFRLCGFCGAKLVPDTVAQEVRKTVSVVFCDLRGSTSLGEALDTESLREVLSEYFKEMSTVLARHGGTVEKYIGDAIMAVFGLPRLHEDDALRAVRAAFEMQQMLVQLNERLSSRWGVRLENRTGVNTGEVVAGDVTSGQRLVTGDTVNTAARLEQAAPTNQILIGEPTYRLVRDAVEVERVEPLELKGKAERVPAYRLISVRQQEGVARRLDAPMVGRERELGILTQALARAIDLRRAQLVTVLGPAGVGKSRLLRELLERSGGSVRPLHGRCLPYGDGITFWPLAEVVRDAAAIDDDDDREGAIAKLSVIAGGPLVAERIGAAIGLVDATFPVAEIFSAARELLEKMAVERPLVVLIDDIHWAEGTFLDLLRYWSSAAEAPILLVCSSRKDLLEDHPEWGDESEDVRTVTLEPLTDAESSLVLENLLGSSLDESIRSRITSAAEGNPLFAEQMLSMMIDDGILRMDDTEGRWVATADPGDIAIPPTISALLAARLDRLSPTERPALERGSVIGQVFFRAAVEELVPEGIAPTVAASLDSLARKDLVRPEDTSHLAGHESHRFVHILIRDAAYHGLLKRTRAELHERFVDWLERVASERGTEYEEIRGYHLEAAYVILVQLGPVDEHIREIGDRGSRCLESAGRRALARGDMPAAATLLQRAASLRDPDDPERPGLGLLAGDALIELGEFAAAEAALATATAVAARLGNTRVEMRARLSHLRLRFTSDPEATQAFVIEEVERAIPLLEELRDDEGLARAWRLLLQLNFTRGHYGAAERAADRMIDHARRAGDATLEARFLPSIGSCVLYGPTPVATAEERCRELLVMARADRRTEAILLCVLAHLTAMQGRFAEAREGYRRSRAMLEELGWRFHAALTSIDSGAIEMLAGDPIAAEAELRRDLEVLRVMGERDYLPTTAALLAEALYRQGRDEDAEALTVESESIAAEDDVASQSAWRSVRGKVLARRGRLREAEALAEEAVRLIEGTDNTQDVGNALMDLADVREAAGNLEGARTALRDAEASFASKGSVVSADRARRRLVELAPVS